jgi:AraC-like DNA-binding protein
MGRGEPASLGTAEVTLARPAIQALDERGVASAPVLSEAGVARAAIERAGERVPYERTLALWELAARAAKDAAFGVHVAATMQLGTLDLIDYLFCTSPTQLDAYRRVAKYVRIYFDASLFVVSVSGSLVKLIRYRRGDAGPVARQYREFVTAALVRRGRDGTGEHWTPKRVSFGHPPHQESDEVERFFGTTVEYGGRADHLWLDRETAALPLRASDSKLSAILLRYADSLLVAVPDHAGFVSRAHHAVAHELSRGHASVARGAARLGMSARTLQRRLRSHHTSHRQLLDDTRFDLASAYLCDPSVSITEMSFLLDFADVSAFTRAFKRWSGMTPSEFRSKHARRSPGVSLAMAVKRGRDRARSRNDAGDRRSVRPG